MPIKPSVTVTSTQWAKQWHPSKNARLPSEVGLSSEYVAWWRAQPCGHEWDTMVASRVRSNLDCFVCAGRRILTGINDLATLNPEVAAQWHPWLNGHHTPEGHAPKSTTVRWWYSEACGHVWDARVHHRTEIDTGCPFCNGKRVLIGFNDIATTHPAVASEWHPWLNGHASPTSTHGGFNKKVWWLCPKNHSYWTSPESRTRAHIGCHFCSGQRVLITFNDLLTTHPELCEEWHPTKNTEWTPTSVSAGSGKDVWWLCRKCSHEWPIRVVSRTKAPEGARRPSGCPECKWSTWGTSETEDDLFGAMKKQIPDLEASYAIARSVEFAAKRRTWRVDMFSPSLNLVIEYDGELWHLPSIFPGGVEAGMAVLKRDHAKTEDLLGQGFRVLRVRSGKLPKITENDLLVEVKTSGALVSVELLPHLDALGWLTPPVPEETA